MKMQKIKDLLKSNSRSTGTPINNDWSRGFIEGLNMAEAISIESCHYLIDWLEIADQEKGLDRFREFVREDWYMYAGCEVKEDGDEPLISECFQIKINDSIVSCHVIIDDTGLNINSVDELEFGYQMDCGRNMAKRVAKSMPDVIDKEYLESFCFIDIR